jgi:hypothetical protein
VRIQKYEHGGRLKVKIHTLFYGENSWTVALRQMKFCTWKDHWHAHKFYLNHHFLWRNFWIWRYYQIMRFYAGTNAEFLCVEFCNFVQYLMFVRCLSLFDQRFFWILEIPTRRPKDTRGCIGPYIYLYLEFITGAKESRLWVQSLNATCNTFHPTRDIWYQDALLTIAWIYLMCEKDYEINVSAHPSAVTTNYSRVFACNIRPTRYHKHILQKKAFFSISQYRKGTWYFQRWIPVGAHQMQIGNPTNFCNKRLFTNFILFRA